MIEVVRESDGSERVEHLPKPSAALLRELQPVIDEAAKTATTVSALRRHARLASRSA